MTASIGFSRYIGSLTGEDTRTSLVRVAREGAVDGQINEPRSWGDVKYDF